MVDNSKVNAFVNALKDKFENKVANKKTDITGDFSTDTVSYPTVQAVKSWVSSTLGSYASSSHTHGNISNDGKVGTASGKIVTTGTGGAVQASDSITKSMISDFPSTMTPSSHTHGNVSNDGKIGSASGKIITTGTSGALQASDSITKSMISDFPTSMTPASHSHGDITNDGKLGSAANKPLITTTGGKIAVGSFGTSANTFAEGNHTHSGYLTSHQSLDSKTVTLEKQSSAESGFAATYVIKQGGTALSPKINIPKDYLLKSASMKTVGSTATATETANNLTTGDVYLEFVVNTTDSADPTYLLIPVNDLLDNISYTADNSTLQLSNSNQFSIKDGGVTKTKLASAVQTSLGYADNWNSSAAKGISSTDISNWNALVSGSLTTSDVDSEIEDYLDAITTALSA